jgi:hypothetical protein
VTEFATEYANDKIVKLVVFGPTTRTSTFLLGVTFDLLGNVASAFRCEFSGYRTFVAVVALRGRAIGHDEGVSSCRTTVVCM